MILGFFQPEKKYSLEEIEQITGKQPEKATWGMHWSIWFANHGYDVKHYTSFDYKAFQKLGVKYIEDAYGVEVAKWQADNSDLKEAQEQTSEFLERIDVIIRHPTITDIHEAMNNGYLVKASVNQKLLNGEDGYIGHSVVVTGIDNENVWFHDPGLPAFKNKKILMNKFQDAMDSFGGEIDIIKKVARLQ